MDEKARNERERVAREYVHKIGDTYVVAEKGAKWGKGPNDAEYCASRFPTVRGSLGLVRHYSYHNKQKSKAVKIAMWLYGRIY